MIRVRPVSVAFESGGPMLLNLWVHVWDGLLKIIYMCVCDP